MAKKLSQLPDRELLSELRNYNTTTSAAPAEYNLNATDVDDLETALNEFEAKLNDWDAIQDDYDAKLRTKNDARARRL